MSAASAAVFADLALWVLLTLVLGAALEWIRATFSQTSVPQRGEVSVAAFGGWDALLIFLLTALLWQGWLGMAAMPQPAEPIGEFTAATLWGLFAGQIFCLLLLVGYVWLRGLPSLGELFGWRRLGLGAILGSTLLLMLPGLPLILLSHQVSLHWLAGFWPDEGPQALVSSLMHCNDPLLQAGAAFAVVGMAPLVEEMVFRGMAYPMLKRVAGAPLAVFGTSLLFALVHGHIGVLLPLMLFSALLILAYERSGCLWVPTAMHAVFNGINVAMMLWWPQWA